MPETEDLDLNAAFDSVTPASEVQKQAEALSKTKELLKKQLLQQLYDDVVAELGSPEAMARRVMEEYAEAFRESLAEAEETLGELVLQSLLGRIRSTLSDTDAMADQAAERIQPEELSEIRSKTTSRIQQRLIDEAVNEVHEQISRPSASGGSVQDLLQSLVSPVSATEPQETSSPTQEETPSTPPAKAEPQMSPEPEVEEEPAAEAEEVPEKEEEVADEPDGFDPWETDEPAEAEGEHQQGDSTPAPKSVQMQMSEYMRKKDFTAYFQDTREKRVRIRCSPDELQEQLDSADGMLGEALNALPEVMARAAREGMQHGADHEVLTLAKHVGERCHNALLRHAEDCLRNQVSMEQGSGAHLVLDTLYYLPDDQAEAFANKIATLRERYSDLGFTIDVTEREEA